jgi:hypothetical protein
MTDNYGLPRNRSAATKAAASRIIHQITTTTDKKFEPVARMADAIVDITLQHGACLSSDLQAYGFTKNEIASLWHFALALADIELNRPQDRSAVLQKKGGRHA